MKRELKRACHVLTAGRRLEQVADDFVRRYSMAWGNGKTMLVCIDKVTCVRMHNLMADGWERRIGELEAELVPVADEHAVAVSEEQGEAGRPDAWGLEIQTRASDVYRHVHRASPRAPSPFYLQAEVAQA